MAKNEVEAECFCHQQVACRLPRLWKEACSYWYRHNILIRSKVQNIVVRSTIAC